MSSLASKVAIVTASTDGIGFAIAERLIRSGASVVVSSRKQKNVEEALSKLSEHGDKVAGTTCHVGSDTDRRKLIDFALQRFSKLDILVNNAATNPAFGPLIDTTEEAWDKIFEINVKAGFLLSQLAVPHLQKSAGNIIFVGSVAAYNAMPGLGAYSISKTAQVGLVKGLAGELASCGIRVNGIAPGVVKTKFSSALWTSEAISDAILQQIPLHRFADADECAGAVAFLASQDSSYITGEVISVNGGMQSRL